MALSQTIPSALAPPIDPKTGCFTKEWFRFLASVALENAFPIGSIYLATDGTDPETKFGFGVWQAISEGTVLVGQLAADPDFGTLGATGGEKEHVLTIAEIPPILTANNTTVGGAGNRMTGFSGGAASPHNNLQPFLVVKIWERVS